MLSPEALPGMPSAYRHLANARALLSPLFQGKDGLLVLRLICDRSAPEIEARLRAAFAKTDSAIQGQTAGARMPSSAEVGQALAPRDRLWRAAGLEVGCGARSRSLDTDEAHQGHTTQGN